MKSRNSNVDLTGKTALVTGASGGIGQEVPRSLASMKARVVLACRDKGRGEAARADIAKSTGNEALEVEIVDFSLQSSIRAFAARFLTRHPALHILVNNAGGWSNTRKLTSEGVEQTWATNMLGYFLLTELLLERVKASAPARIVSVASMLARDLDLSDLNFDRRRYSGTTAYAQSKQANRMWTWALARRLRGTGVTANAMHPGGVATGIFAKEGGMMGQVIGAASRVLARTPARGADTAVWLATSPEVEEQSGQFFMDRRVRVCDYRNSEQEEALWKRCEEMTRLSP